MTIIIASLSALKRKNSASLMNSSLRRELKQLRRTLRAQQEEAENLSERLKASEDDRKYYKSHYK